MRGNVVVDELLRAAGDGEIAQIKSIVDGGCDPNVSHPTIGHTPLYNACIGDHLDAVKLLIACGADPNRRLTYHSPVDGRIEKDIAVLMVARSEGVIDALIGAGADPNARDAQGRTALMRMVLAGNVEAVEALLRAGADSQLKNSRGLTAGDIVRDRLQWLRESLPHLKQEEAQGRIARLERILTLLHEH
jgi:ankyrin repeat protein